MLLERATKPRTHHVDHQSIITMTNSTALFSQTGMTCTFPRQLCSVTITNGGKSMLLIAQSPQDPKAAEVQTNETKLVSSNKLHDCIPSRECMCIACSDSRCVTAMNTRQPPTHHAQGAQTHQNMYFSTKSPYLYDDNMSFCACVRACILLSAMRRSSSTCLASLMLAFRKQAGLGQLLL
jgi:hypothetical protein